MLYTLASSELFQLFSFCSYDSSFALKFLWCASIAIMSWTFV